MSTGGQWGISTSVGLTALAAASARAIESNRPDPLAVDPFAVMFVGAAKVPLPTTPQQLLAVSPPGSWMPNWRYMGVRTAYFDEFFAQCWERGIRQSVILASGLDARAYRLEWPDDSTVFELDQPGVLEFKSAVLRDKGVVAACDNRLVPIDLREDWPTALLGARFDPTAPSAWLVEGLLPYLPAAAQAALLGEISNLSAPRSGVAIEDAKNIGQTLDASEYERAAKTWGTDLRDLVHEDDRRDAAATMAALGWEVRNEPIATVADRYGHALDTRLAATIDASRLVVGWRNS